VAEIVSSMSATVVRVSVDEGQMVAEGDEICVLGSGSAEYSVITDIPGVVRELYVEPSGAIRAGDAIALIDEN
jgi:biotin carboxyl carrier protein